MGDFSSCDNEVVEFPSRWKESRTFEDTNTQTVPISSHDTGTQLIVSTSKETQTQSNASTSIQLPKLSEEEEKGLASFLSSIGGNILKELDKNEFSDAMARLSTLDFENEEDIKCEQVISFEIPKRPDSDEEKNLIKVSCTSWNCVGSLLAVSFSYQDHENWCSHDGFIHFYNTEKSTPCHVINTKSCVTSLSMHPYEMSLVAVGMYSGEVSTYNLQIEDADCLMKSLQSHSFPVTQVSWEYTSSTSNRPVLVSCSLDGLIIVYNAVLQSGTMNIVNKYFMSDPQLSVRPGILCYAFSPMLLGTFVSAVEGGQIYSCSTLAASLEPSEAQEQLYNPVISSFEKHPSNVFSLNFSKHGSSKENIFISCSQEETRIYQLTVTSPLYTLFSEKFFVGISWSITQPQVILCWGSESSVTVFNVAKRHHIGRLDLNLNNQIITSLSCNSKVPNLVATGNNVGEVVIWQIPKYFKL